MSSTTTTTRKAGPARLTALAGVLALLVSAAGASRPPASPRGIPQSDLVARHFDWLVSPNADNRVRAAEYLMRRGNQDAIPAMIDAYIYQNFRTEQLSEALRQLSREDFGADYHDWFEWMVRAGIKGPPIYRKWKADLYSRIDPRFGTFLDASRPHTNRLRGDPVGWCAGRGHSVARCPSRGLGRGGGVPGRQRARLRRGDRQRGRHEPGPRLPATHSRLARDDKRRHRRRARGAVVLHAVRLRDPLRSAGRGTAVHLRDQRPALPLQQADVRPRGPRACGRT